MIVYCFHSQKVYKRTIFWHFSIHGDYLQAIIELNAQIKNALKTTIIMSLETIWTKLSH